MSILCLKVLKNKVFKTSIEPQNSTTVPLSSLTTINIWWQHYVFFIC